jgi:hypothetical protein
MERREKPVFERDFLAEEITSVFGLLSWSISMIIHPKNHFNNETGDASLLDYLASF